MKAIFMIFLDWLTNNGEGLVLSSQLIAIFLWGILFVVGFRNVNSMIVYYRLNKSTYRKRKKGQSFKEWLFYDRFKDVLYKPTAVAYYISLFAFPLLVLICVVINLCTGANVPGCIIVHSLWILAAGCSLYDLIVFSNHRYQKWMKKRGMNKKQ